MKTLRAFSSVRAHLIGEGTKTERTEVSQVAIHFTKPLPVRKGLSPEVEGLRVAQAWIAKRLQFLWDRGIKEQKKPRTFCAAHPVTETVFVGKGETAQEYRITGSFAKVHRFVAFLKNSKTTESQVAQKVKAIGGLTVSVGFAPSRRDSFAHPKTGAKPSKRSTRTTKAK